MRDRNFNQRQATIVFAYRINASKLKNHKRVITPNDIIDDIKCELGTDIIYMKTWRAKKWAIEILLSDPIDGY